MALAGLAFIAAMTLRPEPGALPVPPSPCILCGTFGVQDIILNVLLFVPYGFGLGLAGGRAPAWRAVAIAAGTSLIVELLQVGIVVGRDASLGDLVTNTLGGGLGILLARTWRCWVVPTPPQARRLVRGGLLAWLAIVALTVWGARRALPDTLYWGQWAPELRQFDHFPGALVDASIAGAPFPRGVMGDSPAFRARLLSDSVLVEATVVPARPTTRTAPIVSVFDLYRARILLLGQDGRDAVFSLRTVADAARMRAPAVRLANVFPADARGADTVRLAGGVVHRSLVVRATSGGRVREHRLALDPGLGWSYLVPFDYAVGREGPLLAALWLAALLVPIAYWGARSGGAREVPWLAATLVLGLAVAPPLLGGRAASWAAWLGAIAGSAVGWMVGGLTTRRRPPVPWRPAHAEASPHASAGGRHRVGHRITNAFR